MHEGDDDDEGKTGAFGCWMVCFLLRADRVDYDWEGSSIRGDQFLCEVPGVDRAFVMKKLHLSYEIQGRDV